jgi:hypothetical protein
MPYCLSRKPPASFGSNSASFKLPAPKSAAKNDFVFSIDTVHAARNARNRSIVLDSSQKSVLDTANWASGQSF